MNDQLPDCPDTLECYWVLPGQLLAGEYPASKFFEQKTRRILSSLLQTGIETFIDLTVPGELPPYHEILYEEAGWLEKSAIYRCFPIADFQVPDKQDILKILEFINEEINHRLVYIHCYAGLGRTGLVAGCYLSQYTPFHGEMALDRLNHLRRLLPSAGLSSPQSDAQIEMVKNWPAPSPTSSHAE